MSDSTLYSPQIKVPEMLERAKSQTSTLPVYRDGILVAPSAVKYTLIDPTGKKLLDGVTGSSPGNIATYVHGPSVLPETLNLGEGYVQEWELTFPGGSYIFRRMAAVVLRRLYPVVSDGDLTSTYSQLATLRPSSLSSYQSYIDEAWYTLIQKLRQEGGGLEYLVISAEAFRPAHQNLTLYYIFRDFHSSLGQSNGRYLDLASEHFRQYQHEWKQLNFVYDYDHNGHPDQPNNRRAKQPVIYLSQPGKFGTYRRGRR